jgi:hypothetical protein
MFNVLSHRVLTTMVAASCCACANPDANSITESATARSPRNGEKKRIGMLFSMKNRKQKTKKEQTRNNQ